MHIPVIKKLLYRENLLVERTLPADGQLTASIGDIVEPFNKLGTCKMTYEVFDLGADFKLVKVLKPSELTTFHSGELLGKKGFNKVFAPFDGFVEKGEVGKLLYKSEPKDYWLLPGVWGTIRDISKDRSVLINTQAIDMHIPIMTGKQKSGELIVFPNPSEILVSQYFRNYLKSGVGKIVYVGHHLTQEIVEIALGLNVSVVLAGSAEKDIFDYCSEKNLGLGLFSGFGDIQTPDFIYEFLNNISNRYVFYYPGRHVLQIPVPKDSELDITGELGSILRYVKKGMRVQVFNSSNFGHMGIVDRVLKSSIFVKLDGKDQVVEVSPPNILAIE